MFEYWIFITKSNATLKVLVTFWVGLVCYTDWKRYNTNNFTEENKPLLHLADKSVNFIHRAKSCTCFQEPRTFSTWGWGKMAWVILVSFPVNSLMQCCKFYSRYYPNIFFIRSKGTRVEGNFCPGAANTCMSNIPWIKCLWDQAVVPQVFFWLLQQNFGAVL